MRNIKFRGISKEAGKWVYGYYAKIENDYVIIEINGEWAHEGRGDFIGSFDEIIPETIGQFIGLKGKNDKEAYYQDISEDADGDRYIVEWDAELGENYLKGIGQNCLGTDTEDLAISAIKQQNIIGNKHQNPKYLKEES